VASTREEIRDPAALLHWLAPDRATVQYRDLADIATRRAEFTQILRQWIKYV
jgi:hypothetical protein